MVCEGSPIPTARELHAVTRSGTLDETGTMLQRIHGNAWRIRLTLGSATPLKNGRLGQGEGRS